MRFLHLLAIAILLPLAAQAQGPDLAFGGIRQDTSLPVEITADNLSVDQQNGTAVFSGNVLVGQGEMRLAAPRVLVVYAEDRGKIAQLAATGGVTLVSGEDAAEAERADYNIDNGQIVMKGNVLLTQGKNAMTGNQLNVDLKTGTAQMGGRVKTILQPQD